MADRLEVLVKASDGEELAGVRKWNGGTKSLHRE